VKQQRGLGVADPLPDYDDGRLHVRPADYIATADGVILRLKPRELGLLAALASQPDRIVTRDELLATVWDPDEKIASRAVDACVARLRATLAPAMPDVRYVHTHARIGYRFGQEPVQTAAGPGAEAPGTAVSVEVGGSGTGPAEALAASGESDSASNL
jgi:DNA-binding winged helix-turn-helix (wHTH) protein